MKRLALVCCVLWICAVAAEQTPTPRTASPTRKRATTVNTPAHSAKRKPLTFEVTMMADGFDTAATEAGFQSPGWDDFHWGGSSFKASDGEHVAVYYATLRTEEEAERFFDWKLARVAEVTKRGDKLSPGGKRVGRRAEVVVEADRTYSVIWTNGDTVREILAGDMAHALALEKQYGP